MGPCEPGQVGNEAAISSSFQVRWASHRGPALQTEIRNTNIEIRNKHEKQIRNEPNCLERSFFLN